MARYEHLPIYKAALDVAVGFEKLVAGFSRYHKYTLGTELRNGSRRVVEQVVRANAAHERLPELRVLFVSGFAEDALPDGRTLPEGSCFLQKPFTMSQLAARVRDALGNGARETKS